MPNTYKRRRTGLVNTDIVNAIGLPGVEAIKEDGTVDGTDPRTTEAVFFDGDASTLFWPADFFSVGTGNILRVTFKNPLRPNDAPTTVDVGTITVSTPTTLTGDRTFDSDVTVQGGTTTATLDVGTDATIGNTLTVTGLMTANGAVDLTGPLTLSGELVAEGSSTVQDITITTTAEIKGELNVLGTSTLGGNVTVSPGAVLTSDTIQVTNLRRVDPSDDTKRLVIDDHLDDVAVRALTDALDTRVTTLEDAGGGGTTETTLADRVTVNEGDIAALDTRVTNLDGGGEGTTALADRVTVNERNIVDLFQLIGALDDRISTIEEEPTGFTATGGEIDTFTNNDIVYKRHTFTVPGTDSFTLTNAGSREYRIFVAGGGGGGGRGDVGTFNGETVPLIGGGGGGGQFQEIFQVLTDGTYEMTIGDGGAGGFGSISEADMKGGSTTWRPNSTNAVTSIGGGGGGGGSSDGFAGFHGGGGAGTPSGIAAGGNGQGGNDGRSSQINTNSAGSFDADEVENYSGGFGGGDSQPRKFDNNFETNDFRRYCSRGNPGATFLAVGSDLFRTFDVDQRSPTIGSGGIGAVGDGARGRAGGYGAVVVIYPDA